MTHTSRAFFLILMFVLLVGVEFSGGFASHAASSRSGFMLVNSEQFTPYGQFVVNETLVSTSSTTRPLSSVTFGFPGNYSQNTYTGSASYYVGSTRYSPSVSTNVLNNTLLFTLSLSPSIPAGTTGNVSLGFWVLNTYKPLTVTNYLVPVLAYPSVSVPVDNISSKLVFPYENTAPVSNPLGFTTTIGGTPLVQDWTLSVSNITDVQPKWANIQLNSTQIDSGYIDFQNIQRTISTDASGNVIVTDTLTMKNLGLNTLTNLKFNFLTNSTTISVEPSTQPPLSNVVSMSLANGEINLGSPINRQVEPNDAVTIVMQYNLGAQYWNYSSGVYSVKIPMSVPVNAFVDKFSINYNIPSDFVVLNSPPAFAATNIASSSGNGFLSYRRGIGSAMGFALAPAGLLFIVVFLGVLVTRPKGPAGEDVESTIESMVKAVEEKVSGTNDILTELKGKGENVSRSELISTRERIEELRSKTAARFASLRSQLGQTSVEAQTTMNTVSSNDKELDRAVKDLLNNYDQLISKRMKSDTFARAVQNNERRIQHLANTVLDALHDLKAEFGH